MVLVRTAVSNRDLKKSVEYLGHILNDSSHRAEAELLVGQTLWAAYLEASRLPENERPDKAELAQMFSQAQKLLEAGIERVQKLLAVGTGEVSYSLVAGVLYMAQICLDAGQPQKAVTWLEDPKIGAYTLTKANNKVTDRGNFRVETYKAALRAYVATQRLAQADEVMNALEKADHGADLTRIYFSLGRQLEESLKRIRAKGRQEEAEQGGPRFHVVFDDASLARPAKEANFDTLNWVANTFMSLRRQFGPGQRKTAPRSRRLLHEGRRHLPDGARVVYRGPELRAAARVCLQRSDPLGPLSAAAGQIWPRLGPVADGPDGPQQHYRRPARGGLLLPNLGEGTAQLLPAGHQGGAPDRTTRRELQKRHLGLGPRSRERCSSASRTRTSFRRRVTIWPSAGSSTQRAKPGRSGMICWSKPEWTLYWSTSSTRTWAENRGTTSTTGC